MSSGAGPYWEALRQRRFLIQLSLWAEPEPSPVVTAYHRCRARLPRSPGRQGHEMARESFPAKEGFWTGLVL